MSSVRRRFFVCRKEFFIATFFAFRLFYGYRIFSGRQGKKILLIYFKITISMQFFLVFIPTIKSIFGYPWLRRKNPMRSGAPKGKKNSKGDSAMSRLFHFVPFCWEKLRNFPAPLGNLLVFTLLFHIFTWYNFYATPKNIICLKLFVWI